MSLPAGLSFGQQQLAASTAAVAGGQLQLPSTSTQKHSISNEKLLEIFKSSLGSGTLSRQQLMALISKSPALAEAIKQQKLMKSAAVAAAQNQALKPSGATAGGSTVVVSQPQDANRPSPILPIASATALTSQASVLLNCLSPEQQQQHHRNVQLQQLQQKQLQQLQQQLQQQNLQLVAPGSGQPVHRARLGVPAPPQPALDSTAAANGAGAGLGAAPFSVGRLPHMIVAQNPNDALHHQQQLQLVNNPPQVCADGRPPHTATAAPVRLSSAAAGRPPNPQLTLTLPSRPMHSQLAAGHHAIPTSGFHGDRHGQLNDQSIFTQQSSYTVTLDLPGLGHSMNDGDITPLTPQDQLSRYVERL